MSTDDHIHDPAAIRAAWDEDDPEATRIIRRVGAALNSGRDKAVVDVVLSETDALRREMAEDRAHLEQRTEALSRTIATKDALQAAVETVRALHRPTKAMTAPWCTADGRAWPCPTVEALGDAS